MENTNLKKLPTEYRGQNYFADLARLDVSKYVEKKGQFNYLSWAHAVDQIKRYDPEASWVVKRFPNPHMPGAEIPYMITPKGCFVEVEVTVNGHTHGQLQPVMDFKNKAMMDPDVMDVNKAIQRCLVKAIALHGLGLYIYAGEDLPNNMITQRQMETLYNAIEEFADLCNVTPQDVQNVLKVQSIPHLDNGQADVVIDKVRAWIEQKKEELQKKAEAAEPVAGAEAQEENPASALFEEEEGAVVNA